MAPHSLVGPLTKLAAPHFRHNLSTKVSHSVTFVNRCELSRGSSNLQSHVAATIICCPQRAPRPNQTGIRIDLAVVLRGTADHRPIFCESPCTFWNMRACTANGRSCSWLFGSHIDSFRGLVCLLRGLSPWFICHRDPTPHTAHSKTEDRPRPQPGFGPQLVCTCLLPRMLLR